MSLISLPYALLVEVSEHLYLADSLAHYFDGQSIRLVRLHHGYRILCATNRRLRTMFLHKLYESVFLQLRRAYLQAQTDSIMEFFRFLETHGIIQLIRSEIPSTEPSHCTYAHGSISDLVSALHYVGRYASVMLKNLHMRP